MAASLMLRRGEQCSPASNKRLRTNKRISLNLGRGGAMFAKQTCHGAKRSMLASSRAKSNYSLKKGCLKFTFETAPMYMFCYYAFSQRLSFHFPTETVFHISPFRSKKENVEFSYMIYPLGVFSLGIEGEPGLI